jgi:(p)ppGpp synthase/HD superfamily hydrolase
MEVMSSPAAEDLAVLCALLHDTLEDTEITFDDVAGAFGSEVAAGVQALTKDESLPREEQMADSLVRIKRQPKQVWMVKLADRITNLQEPPHYWNQDKRQAYRAEAWTILTELRDGDALLAGRLERKIQDYGRYLEEP